MTSTSTVRALTVAALCGLIVACAEEAPSNELRASGYVEATEVTVAPEVGGRLVEVAVKEGDRVAQGAVIARLDTRDTELQMARIRAERDVAAAQLRLVEAAPRAEDVRYAQAQVDAAEAEVTTLEVEIKSAEMDLARFESLLAANAGSQKQRDDAKARVDALRERQRGARERVRVAREAVARVEAPARPEEVGAARTRIGAVTAQLAVLEKSVEDAVVKAPSAGIVTQDLVEAGEIVAPRDAARRRHRPRSRLGQRVRAGARGAAHQAGPGRDRPHRRGPDAAGHGDLRRRRAPSSRRATCRPPKSGRGWSTASRSAWTTPPASSSRACRWTSRWCCQ